MAQIIEFPVEAGGVLRVQAVDPWADSGEELVAATGVAEKVQHARETLETALSTVTPGLGVVTRQLRKLAPDEMTVEFGLVLGVEHGIIVAKGKGEVHFTVTLAWNGGRGGPASGDADKPASPDSAGDVAGLDGADTPNGQGGGG